MLVLSEKQCGSLKGFRFGMERVGFQAQFLQPFSLSCDPGKATQHLPASAPVLVGFYQLDTNLDTRRKRGTSLSPADCTVGMSVEHLHDG